MLLWLRRRLLVSARTAAHVDADTWAFASATTTSAKHVEKVVTAAAAAAAAEEVIKPTTARTLAAACAWGRHLQVADR